ncbi:Clp protease ClpP [Halobacillus kuroshimensis]|uniref:ATP-dependent Clp protease proteolytic subunit n=1 Tax=Halobacillus kuroshimensis TaxID=302481 RepID=A0ABS3DZV5_9BACI|nr:head maturation protease, ClpP-related [Halobacillus kuroshimensis]MBN8236839.1 Clp protease ClpP [Halobacillus kuroshimensis]
MKNVSLRSVFASLTLANMSENETLKPYLENMKTEFRAEEKEGQKEADLYIYGPIGSSMFGDTVSAKDVMDFLNSTNAETINLYINSPGGDVFDGLAIYNQLKRQEATVNVHVDGLAASAASIIALGGDNLYMPKTSTLMVHHAWTIALGNAKEFRKVADDLDKIAEAYIAAYEEKFRGTRQELENLLDDETFLSASEAVTFGFADQEVEEKTQNRDEPVKNSLLAKYTASAKKTKPNLLNRFKKEEEDK